MFFKTTYSYDLYGNVSDNGKHHFIYNDAGQLISAQDNNGGKVFLYDARGKRVQSYDNDGHRQIEVYDAADRLMLVEQFDGSLKRKIYLGNKLIAYDDDGLVKYQHFDTLGSVIGVSNNARQLVFENYRPYGDKVEAPQDTGNEQWYTGKPFDEDIELSYYGARYYDPAIGRFYANDPVGFIGTPSSFNRYLYVDNNPYKYVDPDGRNKDITDVTNVPDTPKDCGCAPSLGEVIVNALSNAMNNENSGDGDEDGSGAQEEPNLDDIEESEERIKRPTQGADGAESEHIIERDSDGNTISKTHRVTKGDEVIHQHQDHVGRSGKYRRFPDEWLKHPTINE